MEGETKDSVAEETTLCMICCTSYKSKLTDGESQIISLQDHQEFNSFCKQLEQSSSSFFKSESGPRYSTSLLLKTLGSLEGSSLSACCDCLQHVTAAAKARMEVDLIEAQVLSLQVELLKALRQLQDGMRKYYRQINWVGEAVKESELSCMEDPMDTEGMDEPNIRHVILFRNSILNVMSEIPRFVEDLKGKLSADADYHKKCNTNLSSIASHHNENNYSDIDTDFHNAGSNSTDENQDDDDGNVSNTDDDKDDDDGNASNSGSDSYSSSSTPPVKRYRTTKEELNWFNGQLKDFNIDTLSKFRQDIIRRILRRHMRAKRLVNKSSSNNNSADPASSNSEAPFYYHKLLEYPIEYDKTAGDLVIGGIHVKMYDELNILECSLCANRLEFRVSESSRHSGVRSGELDNAAWNHVVGKHLDGFLCSRCSKKFTSIGYLRMHMKDHPEADISFDCTACGRKLSSRARLSLHKCKQRKNIRPTYKDLNYDKNQLKDFDVKGMSKFRKGFIRRMLIKEGRAKHWVDKGRHSEDSAISKAEKSMNLYHEKLHEFPTSYDKQTGELIVGGVHVKILDELKSVECCLCSRRLECKPGETGRHSANLDYAMWNHVIGAHLKGFQCLHCFKKLNSLYHLKLHLNYHKHSDGMHCDICGKPFFTSYSLSAHKWTHKSEEEKKECEQANIRNSLSRVRSKPKFFQCETCGKEFKGKRILQVHRRIHLPQEDRTVICEQCGKAMLSNATLQKHLRYYCPNSQGISLEIPCQQCDKTFKNEEIKKLHFARMHGPLAVTRPFVCNHYSCTKTFKTKSLLNKHRPTHNKDVQYVCSKGCGSVFYVPRNRRRHERQCDGSVKKGYRIPKGNNLFV